MACDVYVISDIDMILMYTKQSGLRFQKFLFDFILVDEYLIYFIIPTLYFTHESILMVNANFLFK